MRLRTWICAAAAIALSMPGLGFAQQPPSPPSKPPKPAATAGQKVIKDADEYNAYITALNTADPAQKAAAMEAFVARYPKSVVHIDALEQAMAAHQQSGNTAKVEDAANRILKLEPRNVRALAIVVVLERSRATQGQADASAKLREHAELGLKGLPGWKKPEGTDDATYKKMRNQMTEVFNGAAGFVALQAKDYAKAAGYYRAAVASDPGNLQDTYQLAIAELQSDPIDPNGFWHIGRAIALAKNNAAALKSMTDYGKARYRKFHGSEDGWAAGEFRRKHQGGADARRPRRAGRARQRPGRHVVQRL
jgi:tetratricopeptide (TPR) repeat protein